ncbi:hypothetical protein ACFT2C_06070 [Promicromonospora sp. NPDC057138]|uniref:hypothetical protein n=1 Tax=Promicromonospora sp. NPDC057138 TaxID=3346031 RepID=UPI00363C1E8D
MRSLVPALPSAAVLALAACGTGHGSPADVAGGLGNAAASANIEAFDELIVEPSDPREAAVADEAVTNVPALVDPDFSVSSDTVLLGGEPFGTVSEDGVVLGSPAVVVVDPAMGWQIEGATADRAGDFVLLPGGTYRLVDTRYQDLFAPVLDGTPVATDSVELTVSAADRISLRWEPTQNAIAAARGAAAAALTSCADGCPTADGVDLTASREVEATSFVPETDPDTSTTITMTVTGVPVTYDQPFTSAADTTEGTATFTVPVTFTFTDADATAGDVVATLE